MALIVEDGTIVENANSYITLEYFKEYWALRGNNLDTKTDTNLVASIIRGTQYVDSNFSFLGNQKEEGQELTFPRINLVSREGFLITGIPTGLKKACCEAGLLESNGTVLLESKDNGVRKSSVTVGPIKKSLEYNSAGASGKTYYSVKSYLKPYIKSLSGSVKVYRG